MCRNDRNYGNGLWWKQISSTSGNADSTAKQFEINAAIAANPPALDPHTVNANVTGAIGIHIYEALFQMDENYEPQPVLAESYEMSDDGKEYTINFVRE